MAVGGGETQVGRARRPQVGEPFLDRFEHPAPFGVRQGGLGQQGNRGVEIGQVGNLVAVLNQMDRVGRHGHGADRFFVTLVADIDDLVALAGAHADLVMDLGDEGAHRVDDVPTLVACGLDYLGGGTVGAEHDGPTGGHFGDVVDEHHTELGEAVDHELVVDNLVEAVDGRFETANHPGQGLDGHLDARAEPSGCGQQHSINVHPTQVSRTPYRGIVSRPRIIGVVAGSPADVAGLIEGDEIVSIDGEVPRDVIAWQHLVDEPDIELEVERGGLVLTLEVAKNAGEPLGAEVDAALFDRVRTCDNHCPFCFIYQLPKGLRRSLYLKDDDYRLSFLYGNFTTLTRFTEADLERVITERLSPLYVSIHATDPDVRTALLRNNRGATSLRWLRAILDHGIEVHGQLVICPGINDGAVLDQTLCDIADQFPELETVAAVPLGISKYSNEPTMRAHTNAEAEAVVDIVEAWQRRFVSVLGRPVIFAADEYYLLADRPFPDGSVYGDFDMHEDGIGMARAFEREFTGQSTDAVGVQSGFFHWVDGAPAEGYRAPRTADVGVANPRPSMSAASPSMSAASSSALASMSPRSGNAGGELTEADEALLDATSDDDDAFGGADQMAPVSVPMPVSIQIAPRRDAPVGVLTGTYGARIIEPLIASLERDDVRVIPVDNEFFGGNIGVTGLMVGADLIRVLSAEPTGHRYLLPDVCLTGGKFLDGLTPADLPRPVEIIVTDGIALRAALTPAF